MKVFLTWSGERSKALAQALRAWIPAVLQGTEVFMSEEDIEPGEQWLNRIEKELGKSDVGVVCLTAENRTAPWLLYEAGVLRGVATEERVVPYLLHLDKSDVGQPLSTLQMCEANDLGTKRLVEMLNRRRASPLPAALLESTFAKWSPDLQSKIEEIPKEAQKHPSREDRDVLEEILKLVRQTGRPRATTIVEGFKQDFWRTVQEDRYQYIRAWLRLFGEKLGITEKEVDLVYDEMEAEKDPEIVGPQEEKQ